MTVEDSTIQAEEMEVTEILLEAPALGKHCLPSLLYFII